MSKRIAAGSELTIGLDLRDRFSEGRILDGSGAVVEALRVRLIAENDSKSDDVDVELLARLGRIDPSLLKPIVHRGEQAQRDRILIQARAGFVRARTQLVNQVRGFAKTLGTLLDTIDQLTTAIRQMDREVERLCRERYPETELLRPSCRGWARSRRCTTC